MNDNIITWTPTNWVTVFLMAAGGFFLFGVIVKSIKSVAAARASVSADA